MRLRTSTLALLFASGTAALAQESERPPLTLFFGDGTSQPLRAWSLSWEYAAWPKGESPARGSVSRRDSTDLLLGKKVLPSAGLTLEVDYQGAVARGLRLVEKEGKSTALRADPPVAELLSPKLGKDVSVQVRALDVHGETLTGGKRSYCLLSYTALVECEPEPPQRIVKIQFP